MALRRIERISNSVWETCALPCGPGRNFSHIRNRIAPSESGMLRSIAGIGVAFLLGFCATPRHGHYGKSGNRKS